MSVVVVLRVAFGIVDVAVGIMVPIVAEAAAAQRLGDDGVAGLVQDPLAVLNLASGDRHGVELAAAQLGEIDHCPVNSKVLICTTESRADKRSAQRPRASATAAPDLHESTRPTPHRSARAGIFANAPKRPGDEPFHDAAKRL